MLMGRNLEIRTVSYLRYMQQDSSLTVVFIYKFHPHIQLKTILHAGFIFLFYTLTWIDHRRFSIITGPGFFFYLGTTRTIVSGSILFHLAVTWLRSPIFHTPFLFSKWRTLKTIYIASIITSSFSHKCTAISEFLSANSHSSETTTFEQIFFLLPKITSVFSSTVPLGPELYFIKTDNTAKWCKKNFFFQIVNVLMVYNISNALSFIPHQKHTQKQNLEWPQWSKEGFQNPEVTKLPGLFFF